MAGFVVFGIDMHGHVADLIDLLDQLIQRLAMLSLQTGLLFAARITDEYDTIGNATGTTVELTLPCLSGELIRYYDRGRKKKVLQEV